MAEGMLKRGENFDIFISYRRSDGKDIARILNLAFKNAGYRCFLDYNDLEGGVFGKKLESAVLDAPVFAMVLTPDYFARCNQEGDWVRKEIDLALENHKIIVPINYDNVLNGVPDYLDKDFQDRIGCHNFATVFSNDSFEPTFNHVVEVRIRKVMGDLPKQTDKAKVTVVADADCTLLKNNEVIATLQANEDNYILLSKGNHLLKAQSDEFSEISTRVTKSIPEVPWEDFIEIELADKVQARRNEIAEKEEAEKKAEDKHRINETVKRLVQNTISNIQTLEGHSDCVVSVAFSPDGKYIISGSDDKTIKIWDAKSGKCLRTLEGHSDWVISVAFSLDGKYIVSGSNDNTAKIWDVNSGVCIQTLKGHLDNVRSVRFSPDGKYICTSSMDKTIKIWDAKKGNCFRTLNGHSKSVYPIAFSLDGKNVISGSYDKSIKIWDINSGLCIRTLEGHSDYIMSVAISPDGKYITTGSYDKSIKIWDANSGLCLKTLEGHSGIVYSVTYSPDGKYIVSGSLDTCIKIWNAVSGTCIQTIEGHLNTVLSVAFSPDGRYIISGADDDSIKIWGVE